MEFKELSEKVFSQIDRKALKDKGIICHGHSLFENCRKIAEELYNCFEFHIGSSEHLQYSQHDKQMFYIRSDVDDPQKIAKSISSTLAEVDMNKNMGERGQVFVWRELPQSSK